MIKVTRFLTEDGEFFETEEEAMEHEKVLRFKDWYENNRLYCDGSWIDAEDLLDWFKENSKHVTLIFNGAE